MRHPPPAHAACDTLRNCDEVRIREARSQELLARSILQQGRERERAGQRVEAKESDKESQGESWKVEKRKGDR